MQHLEIGEVVDEDLVGEDDDDSVAAETDAFNFGAEGELADAAGLVVVPDHDLVGRIAGFGGGGGGGGADEGEDVAAEEHVDEGDATAAGAEVVAEDLAEGVAVIDAEAAVGGGGEATGVLVEGEVEEGGGVGIGGLGWLIGTEGLRHYYWE